MTSSKTFELDTAELNAVSGGIIPVVFAAAIIASTAAGYVAGRNSK